MQNISPHRFPPLQRWFCAGLLGLLLCLQLPAYAAEKDKAATNDKAVPTVPVEDNLSEPSTEKSDGTTSKKKVKSQIDDSIANMDVIQQTLESLRSEVDNSKEDAIVNRSSLTTIKNGLELIDTKLKEAYNGLGESQNNIATNTDDIKALKTDLITLGRDLRTNISDADSQKSLIEGNATRLYEILLKIADLSDRLDKMQGNEAKQAEKKQQDNKTLIKGLGSPWTLLSIILVSLTPLAYISSSSQAPPLSDGVPQHQGVLLVCMGVFISYFIVGFGIMFGISEGGMFGTSSYLLEIPNIPTLLPFAEFVLYQTGFAMFAALIVYSTVGKLLSSLRHLLLALFVGIVLIPVFGHWAWAGQFIQGNKGWLETAGFLDTAGSTTIHSVAAWFALALALKLEKRQTTPHDFADRADEKSAYTPTAVLFLWLSCLGFTTGALLISSDQIGKTMLNVGLSASAGGIMAILHYSFYHRGNGRIARGLGGFVTGLVAIAASAQMLTFLEAMVVGMVAGILHNIAFTLLRKYFLPQAGQARTAHLVAIHGVGGIWGSLSVALLGSEGMFDLPNSQQLISQIQGIAVALIYSVVLAHVAFLLLTIRKQPQPTAS